MRLKDKVTIITGAGQGIGAAFARKLAAEGAKVVIADINEEMAQGVAAYLASKGYDAMALKTDVSDEENSAKNLFVETILPCSE